MLQSNSIFTCSRPYLISTSYILYSSSSLEMTPMLSWLPSMLARLANTGSVANAKHSLKKRQQVFDESEMAQNNNII